VVCGGPATPAIGQVIFTSYFAVESDWISGLPQNKTDKAEYLRTIKDYADYASKIWAGVLALLLALIALKK
jgi:hypothetical protein